MAKVRVAIVGASGYAGEELIRLLTVHPNVDLRIITSRQNAGKEISEIFPRFFGMDLKFSAPDVAQIAAECDAALGSGLAVAERACANCEAVVQDGRRRACVERVACAPDASADRRDGRSPGAVVGQDAFRVACRACFPDSCLSACCRFAVLAQVGGHFRCGLAAS